MNAHLRGFISDIGRRCVGQYFSVRGDGFIGDGYKYMKVNVTAVVCSVSSVSGAVLVKFALDAACGGTGAFVVDCFVQFKFGKHKGCAS